VANHIVNKKLIHFSVTFPEDNSIQEVMVQKINHLRRGYPRSWAFHVNLKVKVDILPDPSLTTEPAKNA
jgi:hypothetical protein